MQNFIIKKIWFEVKVHGLGLKWTVWPGDSELYKRRKVNGPRWKWTLQKPIVDGQKKTESKRFDQVQVDDPNGKKWKVPKKQKKDGPKELNVEVPMIETNGIWKTFFLLLYYYNSYNESP